MHDGCLIFEVLLGVKSRRPKKSEMCNRFSVAEKSISCLEMYFIQIRTEFRCDASSRIAALKKSLQLT